MMVSMIAFCGCRLLQMAEAFVESEGPSRQHCTASCCHGRHGRASPNNAASWCRHQHTRSAQLPTCFALRQIKAETWIELQFCCSFGLSSTEDWSLVVQTCCNFKGFMGFEYMSHPVYQHARDEAAQNGHT